MFAISKTFVIIRKVTKITTREGGGICLISRVTASVRYFRVGCLFNHYYKDGEYYSVLKYCLQRDDARNEVQS